MRVPGGWIYRDGRGGYQPENTFVPFNNEFMELKKVDERDPYISEYPFNSDDIANI